MTMAFTNTHIPTKASTAAAALTTRSKGTAAEPEKARERQRQVQQLQLWETSFSAVLEELRPVEGSNALV